MILIDKAIGSRELSFVHPLSEVSRLCRLESADIVFVGNGPENEPLSIGIEIKSLSDFIDSVLSGRLHGRQTRLMLSTYDVNYLAIYGVYRCDTATGNLLYLRGRDWKPYFKHGVKRAGNDPKPLQYSFLQSCIFSSEAIGLRVKELPFSHIGANMEATRSHLAHWIYYLYFWWNKRWDEHRSICQLDDSRRIVKSTSNLQTMGLTDNQLLIANLAKELPGLRFDRALAIARSFDTPMDFFNAPEEEIANIVTVSGRGRRVKIGKIVARNIKRELNGKR